MTVFKLTYMIEFDIIKFLLDSAKEFINAKINRDKQYMLNTFNTKAKRSYLLINEIHTDYINSFVKYIEYIKYKKKISYSVFSYILNEIDMDMIKSEQRRINIAFIYPELNIDKKEKKATKTFFNLYKRYIMSIYKYLEMKKDGIDNIHLVQYPGFNDLLCTNSGRLILRKKLVDDYDAVFENDSAELKKIIIDDIESYIKQLNINMRNIQNKYDELESFTNGIV
jgi:hypothetical protein